MGQVIRVDAARDVIFGDAETTLAIARASGGTVASDADLGLGLLLELVTAARECAQAAERGAARALAQRQSACDAADVEVNAVLDALFEGGGRRRDDPLLAIATFRGAGSSGRIASDEMAAHLRLAAQMLMNLQHAPIASETLATAAARLAAAADPLAAVVRETAEPIAAADVAERMLDQLAQAVRKELMRLKRTWLGQQMLEADVHGIIPDREEEQPGVPDE